MCFSSFSQQLKIRDSGSKPEASDELSNLLDKGEESVELSSPQSGRTSRQYRQSGPPATTQNEPLQEEIIEVGGDHTGDTPSSGKCSRIFEVIARGDHEALSDLLTNSTTEVDTIDSEGNTALHCAVTLACQEGDSDENFYQCVDLLMSCQKMNLNISNAKGYTALGLAVEKGDKKCVERMLKHPAADRLYLDYNPGNGESTVREIIMETYPDLKEFLLESVMEDLNSTNSNIKLLAALQLGECNIFSETLNSNNHNPWYDEPYNSSLLEIACQKKNRTRFVELLLDKGADPNIKNRVTGMPLIHATARSGNFELLRILLDELQKKEINIISLKDKEQQTILHWLALLSARKPEDKRNLKDCLNLLLHPDSSWKIDTEDRDRWGNTALYITVEKGFRDRTKLLLSKGADVRVFERGGKILLSDSLSVVKEFLDDCLQHNDKLPTSMDLELRLNYQSLMNIVPRIAESKFHSDLLANPVMSTFLILKWEKLKFVFLSDLVFYFTFLLFLTGYILYSETYNTLNDGGAARNTTGPLSFNDSNVTTDMNDSNVISQQNMSYLFFVRLFLMASSTLLTLREGMQFIVHRWDYVRSSENWLEILLIIATFISCSGVVDGMKIKSHLSAIALLLGWFELLLMSGRLPLLSVQQKMLKNVSQTFMIFIMGYFPLLVAFAFSFYVLFKDSAEPDGTKHFPSPLFSLLKTIVMFSGELEAANLSFNTFPYTSHVIFIIFVLLVAIILLNLLNGLAVNDTEQIAKVAERLSLKSRVRLLCRIEELVNALPKCIKPNIELNEKTFVIYPNKQNRIGSAAVQSLLSIISEKTKPDEKDKQTTFKKDWRMFKEKLSELQILQEKLQKKLESILDE